jgi:hypothetical protein
MDKEKYKNIHKETFLCESNVLESIEASKNAAIKHIMRIVDNNVYDPDKHKNIRAAVLDEINDMARTLADTLERAYRD